MTSYRYYDAGDRRFCYATKATLVCPVAPPTIPTPDEPWQPPLSIAAALASVGLDARKLLMRAHGNRSSTASEESYRTKVCAYCGTKMTNRGYAAWIEAPYDDVIAELQHRGQDASGLEMNKRINERLAGAGFARWPDSHRYFPLKREAIEWAREEAQIWNGAKVTA